MLQGGLRGTCAKDNQFVSYIVAKPHLCLTSDGDLACACLARGQMVCHIAGPILEKEEMSSRFGPVRVRITCNVT